MSAKCQEQTFTGQALNPELYQPPNLGSMGMMRAQHGELGGLKALPIPFGGSSHRLGGVNQPVGFPFAQIVRHVGSLIRCREVQIGSFPTHVLDD